MLEPGATLDLPALRAWAKQYLAPYKVPTRLAAVDAMPRNAMGKVLKADAARLLSD